MMLFRLLKTSIINNVLVPAESGRYITIGHQKHRDSAEKINANRQVTVYYSEGEFSKSHGQSYGDVSHETTFLIELAVATPAMVDLSTLTSETATENEKAKALRQLSEAGAEGDRQMDDLIDVVYQVLMDARNEQFGLNPPADRPNLKLVAGRWVDQIRKDSPEPDGEFLVITASMRLTCRIEETITGEDLRAFGNKVFDANIDLVGDDVEKTGVQVTTP